MGTVCIASCFGILIFLSLKGWHKELSSAQVVSGIVLYAALLYGVNWLNTVYDTADGYASVHQRFGTWARNTLFGSLLYVYVCAFVYTAARFYDAEVLSQAATVEGIMLMGVIVAVFLHLYNEKYLRSRRTRIKKLVKQGVLNDHRRFSMIIEKGEMNAKENVSVYGRIIGELHRGDRVILYRNGNISRMSRVRQIITEGNKVKSVHDAYCAVFLEGAVHEKPDRLSVLSGIREYHENDSVVNAENPVLKALLYEYSRRFRDPVFLNRLALELIGGNYLVPGFYTDGNKRRKDIMDRMESSQITFPSVNSREHPKDAILAVFTDWDSLRKWPDVMASSSSACTLMNFKQVLLLDRMGYKGVVINPFGPVPFFLNAELIGKIVNMPEFQELNRNKE